MEAIQFNGKNATQMMLNGNVIWSASSEEESPYYIEYTVDTTSSNALNGGSTSTKYGLPRIYSSTSDYTFEYSHVEITLLNGNITNDLSTTCNNISKVKLWYPKDTIAVKFYGSSSYSVKVKTVDYVKVDNFTDMKCMFYQCKSLLSVNMENWNTSKVTDTSAMFYYCNKLTSLDFTSWNTDNVSNMASMFFNCESLESLNLSTWNTSKVTGMEQMFFKCESLVSLNLSNFNTSSVTSMEDMFSDIPNFGLDETKGWNYNGDNYNNFTLSESDTGYSGTFPWNIYYSVNIDFIDRNGEYINSISNRYRYLSEYDVSDDVDSEFGRYEVDGGDVSGRIEGDIYITVTETSSLVGNFVRCNRCGSVFSIEEVAMLGQCPVCGGYLF